MFVLSLVKKHYRLQFYMVRVLRPIPKPPIEALPRCSKV